MSNKKVKLKLVIDNTLLEETPYRETLYTGKPKASIKAIRDYYDSDKYKNDMEEAAIEMNAQKRHMGFTKELKELGTDVALNGPHVKGKESYRCRREFHILIVEDSLELRDMYKMYLKEWGFLKIYTATDGLDAMELMSRYKYDLILTDFSMPNMNGYALWRHTQEINYKGSFVMISGYSKDQFKNLRKAGILCLPKDECLVTNLKKVSVGYYLKKLDKAIQKAG